jgi:hypothetical protein
MVSQILSSLEKCLPTKLTSCCFYRHTAAFVDDDFRKKEMDGGSADVESNRKRGK